MGYSIKIMSQRVGLTEYTLRYYEKEGLLPYIERDKNGNRIFSDQDFDWISLICCLRDTGMPISDIKRYVALCRVGDATINARKQILIEHKCTIEQNIKQLKKFSVKINQKIAFYDDLEKCGGTDDCNPAYNTNPQLKKR
ncbi:MAG: MerR family transcriptional regulator [Clostridia bacterium]|nr:MerR family transcriptional regulator [Clostridia bacterium]MDR3643798.1 MerR family transcriptional regulator [Clostridia bacterium]